VCLSQARPWISNVICHGLLIFVCLSQARGLDFQCHMSWSTHFCICPKPGPGFPMSYVMVYSFLYLSQARAWISNVICHGLLIFVCLSQARAWIYNVMVYSFLCVCPKPGVWISNVICHGLLIFVGLSKARGLDF
jgi:hypothetical protein